MKVNSNVQHFILLTFRYRDSWRA